MKRCFLILISSFLFSLNTYAKDELNKALEKCADAQIYLGNIANIEKAFYENNEIYLVMIKERNKLKKESDEAGEFYTKAYQKYWKDNPRPKMPTRETIKNYSFEDYKNALAEYEKKENIYMKPYDNKMKTANDLVKKQEALILETVQFITKKKLESLNLREKAKSINNYTKKFTMCEEANKNTPKSFMLEWGE